MEARWVWQQPGWPGLIIDKDALEADLVKAHALRGFILGKVSAIGFDDAQQIEVDAMANEAIATAAIEGEKLSLESVRSSVIRRLGLGVNGPADRHVEGLVEVLDDATKKWAEPLDEERLCGWHAALFPTGRSGIHWIEVGQYRTDAAPMRIVSGPVGREKVHFEAPPSRDVPDEMKRFLAWFAETNPAAQNINGHLDGLVRAAIAHVWFESIHPFEDGNGRIGRAIVDMAVAQFTHQPVRYYSLSRQLMAQRSMYYDRLNSAQRGNLDVTHWVQWFVQQFTAACNEADKVIDSALEKRMFWLRESTSGINERQRKVLHRLLDAGDGGFEGGLNADKYMKLTAASKATATRDLSDLVTRALLRTTGEGKALRYYVNIASWTRGLVPAVKPHLEPQSLGGGLLAPKNTSEMSSKTLAEPDVLARVRRPRPK